MPTINSAIESFQFQHSDHRLTCRIPWLPWSSKAPHVDEFHFSILDPESKTWHLVAVRGSEPPVWRLGKNRRLEALKAFFWYLNDAVGSEEQ